MIQSNDSKLVFDYINGNEAALEQLINKHKQKVFGFIYSKVLDRDVAEDIFQDTFIKAIITLKEGKYNEEGKFLPWVMRIAHNLCIDYFRLQKRIPTVKETIQSQEDEFSLFDLIGNQEEGIESKIIREQIDADILKLINLLPEDQKQVLEYRIFRDLSFKEIAEETNVSINTALGRMRYALINLRKLIEENQISIVLQ